MKNVLLIGALITSVFLSCSPSVRNIYYRDIIKNQIKQNNEVDKQLFVDVPEIVAISNTEQTQAKGDVTFIVEVDQIEPQLSFQYTQNWVDTDQPGEYDVLEEIKTPKYFIADEYLVFNIRIRNADRVNILELGKTVVIFTVGDMQTPLLDGETKTSWESSFVVEGTEKKISIRGPAIASLANSKIIKLRITNVPVKYDKAGNIELKENFEWFYSVNTKQLSINAKETYSYSKIPVYKEKCMSCDGMGHTHLRSTCPNCNGNGAVKSSIDGKFYTCYKCNGKKVIDYYPTCEKCSGRGNILYPKSKDIGNKSEDMWTGWVVTIETAPLGAQVKVFDVIKKEYVDVGYSKVSVNWLKKGTVSYPIIVSFNGNEIKLLPYDSKGNPLSVIKVDFTKSIAIVKKGKIVN